MTKNTHQSTLLQLLCLILLLNSGLISEVSAQRFAVGGIAKSNSPYKRGWTETQDHEKGKILHTKSLVLHPAPEPHPALKYRLIPSEFNQLDGNAGVHYLRAMGFFEQTYAQRELTRIEQEASKEAQDKGIEQNAVSPFSWQRMSSAELPIEEVKKYLQLTEFQTAEIAAAHQLRSLDFSRNLRQVESPISILLPETQQMRGLARTQSLRCRVAIAELRYDDAVQILGQQFHLASHLGQEPILVSNLVAIAIAGTNWDDTLDFVEMPQAPNLFWAVSALPQPLVPMRDSFSFEREWMSLELKALKDVNEQMRPASYWPEFIDRILPQYNRLGAAMQTSFSLDRWELIYVIAAGYPCAKQYLIESEKMDAALVESYTTAQVFFLAQKKYSDSAFDNLFKWSYLDFDQRRSLDSFQRSDEQFQKNTSQVGWAAAPVGMLYPAIGQVEMASARIELQIAMLQAIEGIRMYAALNDRKLPRKLADLPYPVRNDPFSGEPLTYEFFGDFATLTGGAGPYVYVLNLKIAK